MHNFLQQILGAALQAVDAEQAVKKALPDLLPRQNQRVFLLSLGKAGAAMARGVEDYLGEELEAGWVVVKRGHGLPLRKSRLFEAGHPEPDQDGLKASRTILRELTSRLAPDDLLILLLSGGASALFPAPIAPVTLDDERLVTRLLLQCDADIHQINTVRKHLSFVKGGRLLDYCNGCRVLALAVSDVVGNHPSSIGSGPVSPDPTTLEDCREILTSFGLADHLPQTIADALEIAGETPKAGDRRFDAVDYHVLADNRLALKAAAERCRRLGLRPLILTSSLQGRTSQAARFHVEIAREAAASGQPAAPPCCLLSGGETTVRVAGDGLGGRNQEFVLHCAGLIADWQTDLLIASIGTDGSDGPTDAAGAWCDPATPARAASMGLDWRDSLKRNDSYRFFEPLGQLIQTGPTRTNVMDLHVVMLAG